MSELTIPDRPRLKVLRDSPMSLHTTWRIGGPADLLVRAPEPDDLVAVARWANREGLPLTVIGGGSNLLVGDRGIRGVVALARTIGDRAEKLLSVEDEGDFVLLSVGAQAPLTWVGRYASERGWAGLDWAVGLPGTVGGAVANNAGAHGTEMIDNLEAVTVLTPDGELATHEAAWLQARYRHTIIRSPDPAERRPGTTIVAATLRLRRGDRDALLALADEHAVWRKVHQPRKPCAGSIFKNPPGAYAGLLIEEVGLKGYRVGGAQISPQHANFIVNVGGATGADVLALIREAQRVVREARGIALETEVEFVGAWDGAGAG
jgi:UDP-N-acetylmuramate dehydrogenase